MDTICDKSEKKNDEDEKICKIENSVENVQINKAEAEILTLTHDRNDSASKEDYFSVDSLNSESRPLTEFHEKVLQVKIEKLTDTLISTGENWDLAHRCSECGRYFENEELLKNHHVVAHFGKVRYSFECNFCERKFIHHWFYKNHLDTCHYGIEILFGCIICKKQFQTQKELDGHKVTSHKCLFQCQYCSETYKHVTEVKLLRTHLIQFHGGSPEALAAAVNAKYLEEIDALRQLSPSDRRPCLECRKDMENEFSCIVHLIFDHHKQKCCPMCKEEFTCSYDMKEHIERSKHELKFCTICQKEFGNIQELLKHLENIHTQNIKYPFICECCGKSYRTYLNLKIHYRRHLKNTVPSVCTCKKCGKCFVDNVNLKRHMSSSACRTKRYKRQATNTNSEKMMCNICRKMFLNMDRHNAKVHEFFSGKYASFKCQECNFSSDSSSGLFIHQRTHFDYINSEFVKKVYYKRNQKEFFHHFKCTKCTGEKVFYKRNDISLHLYTEHAITLPGFKINQGKQVKCKRCNKSVYERQLRRHMSEHFRDSRVLTFRCHSCPEEINGVQALRNHFITAHPGSEQADRSAKNEVRFLEDVKTSEMQRTRSQTDIFCTYCKLIFSSIDESDNHNKTVHQAQPVCKLCQEVCTNEFSYKKHEATHKEFPCVPCNSKFCSMQDFCNHLQDTHKRYPYICEICGIYISTLDILLKHYEGKHAGGWRRKISASSNRLKAKLY